MTNLQSQIDALPEWPTKAEREYDAPGALCDERDWYAERLALAREWITAQDHKHGCDAVTPVYPSGGFIKVNPRTQCSCGRDALLAAIEGPR